MPHGEDTNGSARSGRSRISRDGPIAAFVLAGKTGSGKSSFIKLLGGKDIDRGLDPIVDGGLNSCTLKPTLYITKLGTREILLLDTPGFDDSAVDNLEILNEIVANLYTFALQRREVDTQGVIFLHDIAETRFGGSQRKTLELLKAMVGEKAMRNVIIGTTMWSPEGSAKHKNEVKREREFTTKHWQNIYKTVRVFEDDQNSAVQIIKDMLARPPCLLLVQEEMLQPPHNCAGTTAGKIAIPEGRAEAERLKKEFEEERQRMQEEIAARQEEHIKAQAAAARELIEMQQKAADEARKRDQEFKAREEENKKRHEEQMKNMSEENRRNLEKQEKRRNEEEKERRDEANRMWEALMADQAQKMRDQQEASESRFNEERARRDEEINRMMQEEKRRNDQLMEELARARQPPPPPRRGFWDHIGAAFEECVIC